MRYCYTLTRDAIYYGSRNINAAAPKSLVNLVSGVVVHEESWSPYSSIVSDAIEAELELARLTAVHFY